MRLSLSRSIRLFFNPEMLVPFLFGSACLALMGNAAYQLVTNWTGTGSGAVLFIFLGAIAVFVITVLAFAWGLSRVESDVSGIATDKTPIKRRGLVLLVSNLQVCEKAIGFHSQPHAATKHRTLERVWLVCSAKTMSLAGELRQKYNSLVNDDPFVVHDVNNPKEFFDVVNRIFLELPDGWRSDDVICDYTGMTAHGSVGMALACLGHNRPLQYTRAIYDENLKAQQPLDPLEITIDWGLPVTRLETR